MKTLRLIGGPFNGNVTEVADDARDIILTAYGKYEDAADFRWPANTALTAARVRYTYRSLRMVTLAVGGHQGVEEIEYMAPGDMSDLDVFRFLLFRDDALSLQEKAVLGAK